MTRRIAAVLAGAILGCTTVAAIAAPAEARHHVQPQRDTGWDCPGC